MKLFHVLFVSAFFLGFCSKVRAQSPVCVQYESETGLKSAITWTIYKDSKGLIWTGPTGNGACSFNGKEFSFLTEKDGLAGNTPISFEEDLEGNLWIGCQGSGISVYDGRQFNNFRVEDSIGLRSNNVLSILAHSNGKIYVGTYISGLQVYEKGKFHLISDSTVCIYDMVEDSDGVVWLATKDSGLAKYDGNTFEYVKSGLPLDESMTLEVHLDHKENVLIPSTQGLFKYDRKNTFYKFNEADGFPANYKAGRLAIINEQEMILSINDLNYIYSEKNGLEFLHMYGVVDAMSFGYVVDHDGQIWIGSNGHGLVGIKRNGLKIFTPPESQAVRVAYPYKEDIYMASNEGVYKVSGTESSEIYRFKDEFLDGVGTFAVLDSTRIFLGSSSDGIYCLNPYKQKLDKLNDGSSYDLIIESDTSILVAGVSSLVRFNTDTYIRNKIFPLGIQRPFVSLEKGPNGELYAGSYADGKIFKMTSTDTIVYDGANGLSTIAKVDLKLDNNGRLWFLEIEGAFGYQDGDHFKTFPSIIPGETEGFVLDNNNDIWISSVKGIIHVKMEDDQIISSTVYGGRQGVTEASTSRLGMAHLLANGKVIIPKGPLYIIDPNEVEANTEKPAIYFTSVLGKDYTELDTNWYSSYSKMFGIAEELELPYDENNLSIQLGAVYFSYPDSVKYSYQLDGFSDDWSKPQASNLITFTNIPAGFYTLKVKAISPTGESEILEYSFTIETPWFQTWWFYLFVILLGVSIIYAIIKWRISRLQKDKEKLEKTVQVRTAEVVAEKEKVSAAYDQLEEKNQEILDSINYAKRIQTAILPPDELIKESLPNSFVYYRPKDIVAGDFYWVSSDSDTIWIAAADCTGHGVPGAMVSVVCNGALNRSVKEFGLTDPGKILDKTREIVIQEFEKSTEEVKDGMDIALCRIEGNKISYAGAHNPLWIIRKEDTVVEEIKADKQPIGKFEHAKAFSSHEIVLHPGDIIYMFSDGFADQFGGEKGKKFKPANFKKLLLSMTNENMVEQKNKIHNAFNEWMGSLEQLDDVCVIGIQF